MTHLNNIDHTLDGAAVSQKRTGRPGLTQRMRRMIKNEFPHFHPRLWFAQFLMGLLPLYIGSSLRAKLLSLIGFDIGHGTVIWGKIIITGSGNIYQRLHIGDSCWFNDGCHLDLNAPINIGNRVSIGHQVLLLTSSHKIGSIARRAGDQVILPIVIGDGAWLGSRCTILPGITIGEGAVVAAGAVVTKNVPPNVVAAGVPAKILRNLEEAGNEEAINTMGGEIT